MSKSDIPTIVTVCFSGLFVLLIVMYNKVVSTRNQIDYALGGIDAMLKKRFDLIPALIKIVRQYVKHEREVLEQITKLRIQALQSNLSNQQKFQLSNIISNKIQEILVIAESYPELKSNTNFLHLQATLTEVEEQISAARQAYNASIMANNNFIDMFPTSIIANLIGLERKEGFKISNKERKMPDVDKI